MEFMLLFTEPKGAPSGGPRGMAAMTKFASELASQGKLRRGAPLADERSGARVRMRAGEAFVSDGPFSETTEVIGGFWIVDVANREEAVEIARRSPHAQHGMVEVHPVQWRDAVADPGVGTPFLFAFLVEPGLTDPDGTKMREMVEFSETLKHAGQFIETAPLRREPPPARVATRAGTVVVTEGPFAETKDAIGGYGLIRVPSRAEALDLAKRYPHAKWGTIEVREIRFFDPI